jgi:hypothetical protein
MSDLEHCFNLGGKIIVLQENETRFYVENDIDQKIAKIQIDGCLVTKANISKRCDWLLILLKNYTEIYIELKGSRISDAVEQLEETLRNKKLKSIIHNKYNYSQPSKVVCCIIYNNAPNDKRDIGIIKEKFKRNHSNITFKILPKNSNKRPQKLSDLIQ